MRLLAVAVLAVVLVASSLTPVVTQYSTPPIISGVAVSTITDTSATIVWTTDEPANSQVEYGESTSLGSTTPLVPTLVVSHSVALSGLTPSTTYYFRVKSSDAAADLAVSPFYTFTTGAPSDITPPVGGFTEPVNTVAVVGPYVALVGLFAVAAVAVVVFRKKSEM
jgi:phosphodiesterase/alkaline phosphatase D-like protein